MTRTPIVLCILDGVGWGRRGEGDAFFEASTPVLDGLLRDRPWCLLQAHGTAVGLPSDKDMGNSEVGHNAMGAGRVFDQGAKLVDKAIATGALWRSPHWRAAVERARAGGTLHLLGLVSDGNVHSHVDHLRALIDRAREEGVPRLRVHALTDGRDVDRRSALRWIEPLEEELRASGLDYAIATGGGRMVITMDRYEADWEMVARGWATHVLGEGRRHPSATEAIRTLYAEDPDVDDQYLPPFVVGDYAGMADGDAAILFNFRGDRAIEISMAFDMGPEFDARPGGRFFDRRRHPDVLFAGMMEYDGDLHVPRRFLVEPPAIDRTVGEIMAAAGLRVLAISETQKFGHVTYFFNGNRSDPLPGETQVEIPSDTVPFDRAPAMKAREIAERVAAELRRGAFDHLRLNIANGDMVGHTGDHAAALVAMEAVDAAVGTVLDAALEVGAILLITADHGNIEENYLLDRETGEIRRGPDGAPLPSTAHSLNPVPFILVDPTGAWELVSTDHARPVRSIAAVGATLLELCGLEPPADYLPALVRPRRQR